MTRVDVFYRFDGSSVPHFDQYSIKNELSLKSNEGTVIIETIDKGIIIIPLDLIRRIEMIDCGD